MLDDIELSSETEDLTPEIEESESQSESVGEEPQEASGSKEEETQEEKPAPFHEHPRFKELIEQNRAYKTQMEEYQQSLGRLQNEMQSIKQQNVPKQKEAPQDQFLSDLEKVNPEYAKSLKSVYEKAAKAEEALNRVQQYEQQQFAQKAVSHFDSLLTSSKVEDPVDKEIYRSAVEAEVYRREGRGERLGINDLDKIFNSFHAKYAKALQDRERAITAKYVTSKKADRAPQAATGGAATSPSMKKFSSMDSPDTIKWLADELRKSKKTL